MNQISCSYILFLHKYNKTINQIRTLFELQKLFDKTYT